MIGQMFDIMYENRGVGLAANQVNLPLRLFIANPTGEKGNGEELVFLNPVIRRSTGSAESEEGCLSLPGIHAAVKRNKSLHVKAYSMEGREIDMQVDGFLARIIQHEIDHLDGVLFIDRVSPETQRVLLDELSGFVSTHDSKQRQGMIPSDEQLSEQREEWLNRYCR
ncbi:MAG: Peptide deformylase 1 [Planctomycetota bacterium]